MMIIEDRMNEWVKNIDMMEMYKVVLKDGGYMIICY